MKRVSKFKFKKSKVTIDPLRVMLSGLFFLILIMITIQVAR